MQFNPGQYSSDGQQLLVCDHLVYLIVYDALLIGIYRIFMCSPNNRARTAFGSNLWLLPINY